MDGRMPVVAAIERWRQFPGWGRIGIATQRMANVVWVFFVHASECEIRKPLSCWGVKHWCDPVILSTSAGSVPEQDKETDGPFHSRLL